MKVRISVASLVIGLLAAGACSACKGGRTNGPTGKAVPAFQGTVSPDAEVEDITPGTYGGMLVIGTPSNPSTFNAVTAVDTNALWVIGDVLYKSITHKAFVSTAVTALKVQRSTQMPYG